MFPANQYVLDANNLVKNITLDYYKNLYTFINTNNEFIQDVFQTYIYNNSDKIKYLLLISNNSQNSDKINQTILSTAASDLITLFTSKNFNQHNY